jgi:hypothetical protein
MTKPYPNWICDTCGVKYGSWYQPGGLAPKHHCATCHMGTCEVCGKKEVPVTEPRDYGHLIHGWDN